MSDAPPSIREFLKTNASLMLLALAHLPFLMVYFTGLWNLEHYQFFPFALAAFVWIYRTRGDRQQIEYRWPGRIALFLDVLLLLISSLLNWPKLAMVGFVLLCFTVADGTRERRFRHRMTSLTLLPLILITPPRGMDTRAIFWLQQKTTWLASRLLEQMGYLHLRLGNIIELPDKRLLVEEACSGVQSLFTVLFLAILIVCWQRRSLLHAVLLLPSAVLFAGTMNVFRIMTIVVAWEDWQLDVTEGWMHDMLGYVALLLAVLLLMSTDSLLQFLFSPFRERDDARVVETHRNPFTVLWNFLCGAPRRRKSGSAAGKRWRPSKLALNSCGAIALLAVTLQGVLLFAGGAKLSTPPESELAWFEKSVLPQEIDGFRVQEYTTETRSRDSIQGEFSNIWRLTGHGMAVVVSCDHPFLDWHYLNICYTASGWAVRPAVVLEDDQDWPSFAFEMEDEAKGQHGQVIYSLFTGEGQPRQPSNPGLSVSYVVDRIRRNASHGIWSLISNSSDHTSYQVQVFAQSARPITDEQLTALRKLHVKTRSMLQQHYSTSRKKD